MDLITKKKLPRYLLITQILIYVFIIIHSIAWHVFDIHLLTKLCPAKFGAHIGNLEFNLNVVFWSLIFISTLFIGRAFCGWGCMWGAYQDFVSRAFSKLGIQGIKGKSRIWIFAILIIISGLPFLFGEGKAWPTFFWFMVFVLIVALGLWWIIERKSRNRNPSSLPKYVLLVQFLGGIISSWIVLNVFQKGITFAFDKYGVLDDYMSFIGIITVILGFGLAALAVAVEKRFFCKYMCPYGLLLRFMSSIPFSKRRKVRAVDESCVSCSQCNQVCPMGLNPMEEIKKYGVVKSPECINCLRCVAKCPKNTLDFSK